MFLWDPKAIILVDSEIWPNLITIAKKNEIPIGLINARITNKTYNKWMAFKTAKKFLNALVFVLHLIWKQKVPITFKCKKYFV